MPDSDLMQKIQLLQLLNCASNPSSVTDYLLRLLPSRGCLEYCFRCSMPNAMLASSFLSAVQSPSTDYNGNHGPSGGVHQATLQEYLDATALLNSVPSFIHDGSGDGPKK